MGPVWRIVTLIPGEKGRVTTWKNVIVFPQKGMFIEILAS